MSSKDGTKVTKAKGKAVESDVKDDWEDSSDEEQQPESQLENDLTTSTTHPGPKPQQKEEDFPPLSNEKISRAQGRAKGTSSPASGSSTPTLHPSFSNPHQPHLTIQGRSLPSTTIAPAAPQILKRNPSNTSNSTKDEAEAREKKRLQEKEEMQKRLKEKEEKYRQARERIFG